MALKVPIAKESVDTRDASGAIPSAQFSRPPQGAFGADVAGAQGQVGKAISQAGAFLGQHMVEQAKIKADDHIYTNVNGYKGAQRDMLYSTELENWTDKNGAVRQRAKGFLNQVGEEAEGSEIRYRQSSDQLKQTWSGPLKNSPYASRKLTPLLDSQEETGYASVVAHSAQQWRNAKATTLRTTVENYHIDGTNARSADELNVKIHGDPRFGDKGLLGAIDDLGVATGHPELAAKTAYESVGKMAGNFATNFLKTNGSVDATMIELEKVQGLSFDQKSDIRTKLDMQNNAAQAIAQRAIKIQQAETDATVAQNYGTISPQELEVLHVRGAAGLPGGISDSVYDAIKSAQKPTQLSPEDEADLLTELADAQVAIMKGKKIDEKASLGDTANYHALLIKAHKNRAISDTVFRKNIGVVNKILDKGIADEVNSAYRATAPIWDYFKNFSKDHPEAKAYLAREFMDRVERGPIPNDQTHVVAQEIMKGYLRQANPNLLAREDVPHSVATKETGFSNIYDGDTKLKADRSVGAPKAPDYDPKTQELYYNKTTGKYKVVDIGG